jgi:phasin
MTPKMPNPFEVPNEMRDLAAKSVEQAKRAFDSFLGAARQTSDQMAAAAPQLPASARDAGDAMLGMAESNVKAALELAEKLVQARGMDEVMRLQSDYMRAQMEAMKGQMESMGAMVQNAARGGRG